MNTKNDGICGMEEYHGFGKKIALVGSQLLRRILQVSFITHNAKKRIHYQSYIFGT